MVKVIKCSRKKTQFYSKRTKRRYYILLIQYIDKTPQSSDVGSGGGDHNVKKFSYLTNHQVAYSLRYSFSKMWGLYGSAMVEAQAYPKFDVVYQNDYEIMGIKEQSNSELNKSGTEETTDTSMETTTEIKKTPTTSSLSSSSLSSPSSSSNEPPMPVIPFSPEKTMIKSRKYKKKDVSNNVQYSTKHFTILVLKAETFLEKMMDTMLPDTNYLNGVNCKVNIIRKSGTIKRCKKFLLEYFINQLRQYKIGKNSVPVTDEEMILKPVAEMADIMTI